MNKEEILEQYHQKGGTYILPVEVMNDFIEDYKELQQEKENLIKYLEDEKVRLKRECSPLYTDSLGKTKLVSEDIYNVVNKILEKARIGKYE